MKVFPAEMLGSGCGALELRKRESEDGGAVRESRNGERVLILLKKGKRVLKARVLNFLGVYLSFQAYKVQYADLFLLDRCHFFIELRNTI